MTTLFVQARKKPPVLIPLREPQRQPAARLHARIQLIVHYAERHRELDDIEARELLNLRSLLATGRPWRGAPLDLKVIEQELLS